MAFNKSGKRYFLYFIDRKTGNKKMIRNDATGYYDLLSRNFPNGAIDDVRKKAIEMLTDNTVAVIETTGANYFTLHSIKNPYDGKKSYIYQSYRTAGYFNPHGLRIKEMHEIDPKTGKIRFRLAPPGVNPGVYWILSE